MKTLRLPAALTTLALLVTACSSLSSRPIQYVGVQRYAPSDPASIQILHTEPNRPFDRIGEVVVDTSVDPSPSIEKIEAAIRKDAAKMGADAVLLVRDQSEVVGMSAWGPWWAPNMSPIHGRQIVAVALKYRADAPVQK